MKFLVDVHAPDKYRGLIESTIKEAVFEQVACQTEVLLLEDDEVG